MSRFRFLVSQVYSMNIQNFPKERKLRFFFQSVITTVKSKNGNSLILIQNCEYFIEKYMIFCFDLTCSKHMWRKNEHIWIGWNHPQKYLFSKFSWLLLLCINLTHEIHSAIALSTESIMVNYQFWITHKLWVKNFKLQKQNNLFKNYRLGGIEM